ncbi:MAG: hypothetical protein AB1523_08760 [Bacillota bacterium]
MNLHPTLRLILRISGLGLLLLGVAGNLPSLWAIGAVAAGLAVFLIGGKGFS